MNSICLITFNPHKIWCNFLNSFTKYKIFIIVDDNNFNLSDFKNNYKNITFIKVPEEKCKMKGYVNVNYMVGKLISGWDKALYYFAIEHTTNDFIWFIEDDVCFYNENTIINIDEQYINDDMLSNTYNENRNGNKRTWNWSRITIQYSPPYYNGMMCAVRFSKKMLKCVNDYAIKHKTLCFLEALFPTIVIKNNLKYSNPSEFNNIYYRHTFAKKDITTNNLYHPLKDLNNHILFRELLRNIK